MKVVLLTIAASIGFVVLVTVCVFILSFICGALEGLSVGEMFDTLFWKAEKMGENFGEKIKNKTGYDK